MNHALEAIRAYHKAAHTLQSLRLQAAVSERYAAYVAQPIAHMERLTETAEQIAREYAPQLINTGA